jgi:hypothetical protein
MVKFTTNVDPSGGKVWKVSNVITPPVYDVMPAHGIYLPASLL